MNVTAEQISSETIALIELQARLAGMPVDYYLRSLLSNQNGKEKPRRDTRSREERMKAFDAWVDSHKSDAPALAPEDIGRDTIY